MELFPIPYRNKPKTLLAACLLVLGGSACQSSRASAHPPLQGTHFLGSGSTTQALPQPRTGEPSIPTPFHPPAIDLASALKIGGAGSLQVALAREGLEAAQAQQTAANVLLFPTLTLGGGYQDHDGSLQATTGEVLQVDRNSAFMRGSLIASIDLAQAFLEPGRAREGVHAARAMVRGSINQNLTRIALAHQDLLQAQLQWTQAQEDAALAQELVELTEAFARAGQGLEADAARARSEAAQRSRLVLAAKQTLDAHSTQLATLLRLDPRDPLRTAESQLIPMALFPEDPELEDLLTLAQQARPELQALRAAVRAEEKRESQEDLSFLLPTLNLGLHTGRLGGAPGSSFRDYSDTDQFSATLTWSLRNLGLGEAAARREAEAHTKSARLRLILAQDRVAQEVILARLEAMSSQAQIRLAFQNKHDSQASLKLNLERSRAALGLPIEALQAIRANAQANREYLQAVADYNRSQFRLLEAVGSAPRTPQGEQ